MTDGLFPAEPTEADDSRKLDILLKQQRTLGWLLSTVTLVTTVGFFTLMSMDAPILARIALGRSITVAMLVAIAFVLASLASIALFGWRARRIDVLLDHRAP